MVVLGRGRRGVGVGDGSAQLGMTGDIRMEKQGRSRGGRSVVHAVMFAVAKWEKGDGGCNRSGDSGFWGRTTKDSFIAALVLPIKVVNNCKMVLLAIDGAMMEALGSTSKGRQQC
ncbi:hypothetical protein BHM03_00010290 [Ensete ventricosum]|nr:hypothetical protein BHM03_00010290 [Ensete ventricosum]